MSEASTISTSRYSVMCEGMLTRCSKDVHSFTSKLAGFNQDSEKFKQAMTNVWSPNIVANIVDRY